MRSVLLTLGKALLGVALGAVAGFISLEVMGLGLILSIGLVILLVRWAGAERWVTLGGVLIGAGVSGSIALHPALTNHDPAVTYDPSTIPVFWLSLGVAAAGAATIAVAALKSVIRCHRELGAPT
jgi:hypothetical protein